MLAIIKSLWWYRFLTAWSAVWMAASIGNLQRGATAPSEWLYPVIAVGHAVLMVINIVLLSQQRRRRDSRQPIAV